MVGNGYLWPDTRARAQAAEYAAIVLYRLDDAILHAVYLFDFVCGLVFLHNRLQVDHGLDIAKLVIDRPLNRLKLHRGSCVAPGRWRCVVDRSESAVKFINCENYAQPPREKQVCAQCYLGHSLFILVQGKSKAWFFAQRNSSKHPASVCSPRRYTFATFQGQRRWW